MQRGGRRPMQLYVETADPRALEEALEWRVIDGVMTSPRTMATAGHRGVERLHELLALVSGPVFVEVTAQEAARYIADVHPLALGVDARRPRQIEDGAVLARDPHAAGERRAVVPGLVQGRGVHLLDLDRPLGAERVEIHRPAPVAGIDPALDAGARRNAGDADALVTAECLQSRHGDREPIGGAPWATPGGRRHGQRTCRYEVSRTLRRKSGMPMLSSTMLPDHMESAGSSMPRSESFSPPTRQR